MSNAFAEQVGQLARRSVVRTARQPANVVFPLVFPLLLLAVNASGLQSATHLPGFPTDSYLAFALAVPFMQGALFATMNAGTDLARDIQTGFLNRLALTPMRGIALLGGQLGGVMAMTAVQALVWILTGLVSLGPGYDAGVRLMEEAGAGRFAGAGVVAGAVADFAVGLGIAFRRAAGLALYAAITVSIFYIVTATALAPGLWSDPLGPLVKIAPILVLNLVALAILGDR